MSRTRRSTTAALAAASALGLVVAGVAPASAGSTTTKSYPATWASTGDLALALSPTSATRLVDQDSYDDKVNAKPASPETVAVEGVPCAYGTAYSSGLAVWGAGHTWAAMPVGGRVGVRVQVACQHPDGVLHRYNWGAERLSNGSWSKASTNCVVLTRTDERTFTLAADAACRVQDEVLDPKPSKQLSATNGLSMPFEAVVTLTDGYPAPSS